MAPADPSQQRSTPVTGIIIAAGAVVLLVMLLLIQPRPGADVPVNQGPVAMAVVSELMTNGVLVDYDCLNTTAWVNRAVWGKYNVEQRGNMVISLATACAGQRGTYRISIVDFDSKRQIASFDGKQLKVDE